MADDLKMGIHEWLEYGWKKGYCGPPVCYSHDGIPMADYEDEYFAEGDDPCLFLVRLYEDDDHREAVEDNHTASKWRASNVGWER